MQHGTHTTHCVRSSQTDRKCDLNYIRGVELKTKVTRKKLELDERNTFRDR